VRGSLIVAALAGAVLAGAPPAARAQGGTSVVILVPPGARSELVRALAIELAARGASLTAVQASDRAAPVADPTAEITLAITGDANPLAPPFVVRVGSSSAVLLPAALDVIEPRTFALVVATLLDEVPAVAIAETEATGSSAEPAAPSTETATEPVAAEPVVPEAPRPDAPPRRRSSGFRPGFRGRLGADIGASGGGAEPGLVLGGHLELAVQLQPWLSMVSHWQAVWLPGSEAGLGVLGLGFGVHATGLPGALSIEGLAIAALGSGELRSGLGGALVAAWEWPIDYLLRIGPRAVVALWNEGTFGVNDRLGYMVTLGIDVLGFDVSL
jgi:hypothetical protein